MRKFMMTLAAVLSCAMTMTAEPVSPQAARKAAAKFLKEKGTALKAEALRTPRRVSGQRFQALQPETEGDAMLEATAYYVFNASRGFVVVSGDDCVGDNLILGYTDQGRFDADAVPSNLQWWLDEMQEQISTLSQYGMKPKVPELHADIDTLVTALWDQGSNVYDPHNPYNALCPVVDDKLCITGCMATALAQVMYYHRWPQDVMNGPLHAYQSTETLALDELPATKFDWNLMVDNYHNETTEEQQMAVAKLMRYCGQSVQMSYTPSLGASSTYDLDLLVRLFGYDQEVFTAHADHYTPAGWDSLIYNELKEGRPLVYMGFATGMGHAFVLDGYRVDDGVGLYHVNWGWGGIANGYFRMAVLNPNAFGAGASNTPDGYNRGQRALVGLQPAKAGLKDYGRYLEGFDWNVMDNDEIPNSFSALNSSYQPGTFAIQLFEEMADGTLEMTSHREEVEFPGFNFLTMKSLLAFNLPSSIEGLAAGWHKLRFMQKEVGTDAPWKPLYGPTCYMEALIGENGEIMETVIHPVAKLNSPNRWFKVEGVKQRGLRQMVSLPVTNDGDEDYIGALTCFIYIVNGSKLDYLMAVSYTGIMLDAGAQETYSFPMTVNASGDFIAVVRVANEMTDIVGTKTADIKKVPGYVGHRTFKLDQLQIGTSEMTYNVTTDEQGNKTYSFDFGIGNYTTLNYDALVCARLYTLTDDNYIIPYQIPGVDNLVVPLTLPKNAEKMVSIPLPGPLEPNLYYVEAYLATDFNSYNLNDYFPFQSWAVDVFETVGISDAPRLNDKEQMTNDCWYDLQGRKLSNSKWSNGQIHKGVYIYKGKKVILP